MTVEPPARPTNRTAKLRAHVDLLNTEDGTVLVDQRRGTSWQLNDSGAFIIRQLLEGVAVEKLAAVMTVRYPVEEDAAQHTILALLDSL